MTKWTSAACVQAPIEHLATHPIGRLCRVILHIDVDDVFRCFIGNQQIAG